MPPHLTSKTTRESLISWFAQAKRPYPWTFDMSAYRVWISEIMLQQTVVQAVIPHFEDWMRLFPDIESLAEAEEEEILKQWQGLGYYSRARNILRTARIVVQDYQGQLPHSYGQLTRLPGIGDYTACAILSFAYNQPYAVIDANVKRIVSRLYEYEVWTNDIEKTTKQWLSECVVQDSAQFNAGMMQLGQQVCLRRNPLCHQCPFQQHCLAYENSSFHSIPASKKQVIKQFTSRIYFLFENEYRQCYLMRSQKKLGQGLYYPLRMNLEEAGTHELAFLMKINAKDGARELDKQYTHLYTTNKETLQAVVVNLDRLKQAHPLWYAQIKEYCEQMNFEAFTQDKLAELPMNSVYGLCTADVKEQLTHYSSSS